MFWSFQLLAGKTNNEHLPKPFSKVTRKSLYLFVCFNLKSKHTELKKRAVLFFELSTLTKRLKQDSLFKEGYLKEKCILEITKATN